MRVRWAWGLWGLALAGAWAAVAQPWDSLVGATGGAFWWQLRQQGLYLSGILSIGMMSLVMLLALRQPWMEKPLGGMDQVYRLHKWAGIMAAVAAVLHWAAKESDGWIKDVWGREGHPARDAVLSWATTMRGTAKDVGEWAFYALLLMVVITLWQRLLPYKPWRYVHRIMPVLYLLLAFHTAALLPLALWTSPLGVLMGGLLVLGSGGAVWSLLGRIGRGRRSYAARVHAVQLLGKQAGRDPLEVLCAMPARWPGHTPGQFVFASFDGLEGAHPFTIASAPQGCGRSPQGEELLRLVIKPLGDYTQVLHAKLQPGQPVRIEGPYGCFDTQGAQGKAQVWIAGGVGITPFLALLQARQPGAADAGAQEPVHMHYCTRQADQDVLLPTVRALCASAQPAVQLQVHDSAQGDHLKPEHLVRHGAQLDIWLCGPVGLGKAMRQAARQQHGWCVHQEAFQMR